jgi:hypothetical protein
VSDDYERWTRDEVAEWPGAAVEFRKRAKHREAVLTFGEQERFVIFPDSPSDSVRGVYNHVGTVRRELIGMGAVRKERAKATAKRERNPGAALRDLDVGEPAPVRPDPWEALQELAERPLIGEAGSYSGVSSEDYHRNPRLLPGPSISSSGLKTLLHKSPRHYWWDSPLNPERPPEKDKPHFNIGKAAHDVLLLSERWPEAYHVLPEDFNANATNAQAEWHAERAAAIEAGKTVLKHEEAKTVLAMAEALKANEFAVAALANGESEVTLAWQDPETSVWLRARPDFLPVKRRIIPDLKTAANAAPKAFARAMADFGYAQSAALYIDGIKAVFGDTPTHWVHIVIEKEPPHVVSLYELPGEDIERGRWLNRRAIRIFAECLNADRWPGYADEPTQVGLPQWERKTIDEGITPEGSAWSQAA